MWMWGIILALCQCVCVFSSFSCIFRAPLRSHWLISCKRYILKVELWKAAWGEKCFFFRFYSRCSSLQVPKVAQVGRWKVLEWPQCCWPMRVTRKWISSKDSMKNDISENAAESQAGTAYRMTFPACFQPMGEWLSVEGFSGAHRWKWRWWLNRFKTKTSQTCLGSNLSRTWGHLTQVWICGTLWQQQSFPFPCLPLTLLCFSRRWEESCLFYVMLIIMWRGWESLAFQSKVRASDTFECA